MHSPLARLSRVVAALGFVVGLSLPLAAQAQETLQGAALLNAMSKGGYVVYMRHTKTDNSQKDTDVSNLSNCATQRNLSDEGRAQAAMIGKGLKKFGVTFGNVVTSPYCRAVETTKIAFGGGANDDNLRYLTRLTPAEAETATAWLKKQLGTAPKAGTNTVLVSHTANLKTGTGIWPKNSGDVVVFKPGTDGSFAHIGTITPDQWQALLGSAS